MRRPWLRRGLIALGLLVALGLAAVLFLAWRGGSEFSPLVRFQLGESAGVLVPPAVGDARLLDVSADEARKLNSDQPFVTRNPEPARPFRWTGDSAALERAVDCLAAAAWYEAGDDALGERSVVQVVLNRARHPAFPSSVCGVVFQGSQRTTGCQFTFTCDGALSRIPSDAAWQRARVLARAGLSGYVDTSVGTATHYHTDWVVPYWRSSLEKIGQVRTHLFYRWSGYWGRVGAFRQGNGDTEPVVAKLARISAIHRDGEGPPLVEEQGELALAELPAPMMLEGVRDKSLRNSLVRAQIEHSNTFFMQVDPLVFPGNYATAALAVCKGKTPCRVLAWQDPTSMALKLPMGEKQARSLSFYFSHDEAGGDRALWNCGEFKRNNAAQCLPDSLSDIEALVGRVP